MGKTIKTDMLKVRITPELKAEIQAAAESENRTVSGYIINLIMQDITKKAEVRETEITDRKRKSGAVKLRFFALKSRKISQLISIHTHL